MAKRTSIYVDGFGHKNPIPAACRIGNLVMSGGIHGIDPATGRVADGLDDQCRLMLGHVRRIVEAAGGTLDDIVKLTVWMTDRSQRAVLNRYWVELFPDEQSRPARHTMTAALDGGMLVQCDFTAVLGG